MISPPERLNNTPLALPARLRFNRVVPPQDPVARFYARTRDAHKLIVVDLGFLGDSVHLVPACWELKRHYPQAELHTLSATIGAEVLALAPCVDRAWAYPLSNPSPPWWKHLDILRALRRERFDVAITFSGGDRPVYVTTLCGARHRLAHDNGRKHFYNPWLIQNWVSRRPDDQPVFEQRLQVLAAAGFSPAEPRWDLKLPDDDATWASARSVPRGAVHLSLNSNTDQNEWPVTAFAELARQLLAQRPDLHLVLTASAKAREQQRLDEFCAAVPDPRVHRLPASLTLAQLAAVLRASQLHLGPDSGVMHLAAALGVPTVATFRERPGWRQWVPLGSQHRTVSVACRCAHERPPPCAPGSPAACLTQLPIAPVLAAVRALLARPARA